MKTTAQRNPQGSEGKFDNVSDEFPWIVIALRHGDLQESHRFTPARVGIFWRVAACKPHSAKTSPAAFISLRRGSRAAALVFTFAILHRTFKTPKYCLQP